MGVADIYNAEPLHLLNVDSPPLLQDVQKSAEAAKAWQSEQGGGLGVGGGGGGGLVREAGPLPGLETKITSINDSGGCTGRLGRCRGCS